MGPPQLLLLLPPLQLPLPLPLLPSVLSVLALTVTLSSVTVFTTHMNLLGAAYLTTVPALLMVKEVQGRRLSAPLVQCLTLYWVTVPVLSTTYAVTLSSEHPEFL